jgi:hypothetical protein
MKYKIISQDGNQTLIETDINDEPRRTLVVCNEGELDEAVETFIESVKNPKVFTPQVADPAIKQSALNKLMALGLTEDEALALGK